MRRGVGMNYPFYFGEGFIPMEWDSDSIRISKLQYA